MKIVKCVCQNIAWLSVGIFLCLAGSGAHANGAPVQPAKLLGTWWIDGSEGLDISGLSFCDGELLAVADKSSEGIYRLPIQAGSERVELKSKARFARPDLPDDQPVPLKVRALHYASTPLSMDFEGITCDASGVYLLSERHNRIAQLDTAAERARWLSPRWSESARERGYLQIFNAESEGLVKAGEDFWVALEREPRGLLRLGRDEVVGEDFRSLPEVAGLDFRGRAEDVTALAYFDGGLFTLERNAFAVCRRELTSLRAEWCVHYRDIEEAPKYVYQDTRFGKGEGLAINQQGIFVVLDNNGDARVADAEDRRGLLIQLAMPPFAIDAQRNGARKPQTP
ncbi:hypothetical protein [Microbulbifer agarilyticus]